MKYLNYATAVDYVRGTAVDIEREARAELDTGMTSKATVHR